MIQKLRKRIFSLIMVSLSILVLGFVFVFGFFNYNNIINTAVMMMDRVMGMEPKKNFPDRTEERLSMDGIYVVLVEDNRKVQNLNKDYKQEIEEYALKVAKKKAQKGVIGTYIYKIRRTKEHTVSVTLMEHEKAILQIRINFVLLSVLAISSIILIYAIAKKLSDTIVKPAEETLKKQKQFISDASHELKTPLAVIKANVDVLENEMGKNKWIDYVQNEIESMNKLINELLLLAKIEHIDSVVEHEQFDISKEVEIILSMFESIAYEKQISLKSNIQENITMEGKKEDIQHILSTLVDNAMNHTPKGKEVVVELKREKSEIVLEVKNEGEPIKEEEREKIFERFYRIEQARSRKEKRYGLGLAIAKATLQKYKGQIKVEYKDNFTVFEVRIPWKK